MKVYLKTLVLTSMLWLTPLQAHDVVVNRVVSVYDADTFRVDIYGWPQIIGENIPIRVLGVDAPEMRSRCHKEKIKALLAREFTKQALDNAKVIVLRNIRRGKYFRILANVYIDGRNLSDLLLEANHARPYNGGKRLDWCS